MEKHTVREYVAALEWIEHEIEDPRDPILLYLMSIATEIRRLRSSKPESVQLQDLALTRKEKKELTEQEKVEHAKRKWFSRLGMK